MKRGHMNLIAKRSLLFGRERFKPIKSFRKIKNKELWECEGEDNKSFLSEEVYKRITRQSAKRRVTHDS